MLCWIQTVGAPAKSIFVYLRLLHLIELTKMTVSFLAGFLRFPIYCYIPEQAHVSHRASSGEPAGTCRIVAFTKLSQKGETNLKYLETSPPHIAFVACCIHKADKEVKVTL